MQNLLKFSRTKKDRVYFIWIIRFLSISFLNSFYKISSIVNVSFLKKFSTSLKIFHSLPDFRKMFSKIITNLRWSLRNCCTLSIFSAPPPRGTITNICSQLWTLLECGHVWRGVWLLTCNLLAILYGCHGRNFKITLSFFPLTCLGTWEYLNFWDTLYIK